jgi:peptide/nickel transport system ATP-binding protein
VDGVDLHIDEGETLGVVGESGSGKSVTAFSVMRLLAIPPARIAAGEILWRGRDLLKLREGEMRAMRAKEIAMVFQEPMTSLNPVYSVGDQIAETVRLHEGASRRAAMDRAVEMLKLVRIPHPEQRVRDYPHQFSGGMRQRVMIAMALSCNPKLLIADEPTTALDVTVQAGVLDLLEELRESHDMSMIIITHDMGVIAEAADDVAVMYAGQIVEQATAEDLFENPEHPYTEALLGALPQIEGEGIREGRLTAIPGRPPNLVDPPEACRFAPRCRYANDPDSCTREMPQLREVRPGHWVRSAHPASERAGRREAVVT